jgi:hypothetical protein
LQQYIARLQQLLHVIRSDSNSSLAHLSNPAAAASAALPSSPSSPASPAAAAQQQVCKLVLHRREMTDRHALFSHYYWAIWCLNSNEVQAACLQPPSTENWRGVMQQLQLSRQQLCEVVDARRGLLQQLQRVAAEWQKVLPTLALQLLQVRRACNVLAITNSYERYRCCMRVCTWAGLGLVYCGSEVWC